MSCTNPRYRREGKGANVSAIGVACVADHPKLVACIRTWWGGSRTPEQARELSLLLPRLFLQHFARTSLVLEGPEGVEDFLVGFVNEHGDVRGRPVGVATAKDGSLMVTDDGSGTVWRVSHVGEK